MFKRIWAFALSLSILCSSCLSACAATLGPASSYDELQALLFDAAEGDTILVSGEISAAGAPPLTSTVSVRIRSNHDAVIHGLHLKDASVMLSGVSLADTLTITGTSHVQLGRNVSITGSSGKSGLSFSGNGTLIIEDGCKIEGGYGSTGISIQHLGGEFYSSIEGVVRGGSGVAGGAGMVISPLRENGAVMITGSIEGGVGDSLGGHALNLYELSGNAYVTVDGTVQGGSGAVGGDGIQIVSVGDSVSVGISGQARGGAGESYGGNALILMNTQDASSFHISGHFSGGDAFGADGQPGTSIQLVGHSASTRARIDNCILEDGRHILPTPQPTSTPEPLPLITPLPEITPPAEAIEDEAAPAPTPETPPEPPVNPEESELPTSVPTIEPTVEPSSEPEDQPALDPDPSEAPSDESNSSAAVESTPEPEISAPDAAQSDNADLPEETVQVDPA